MRLSKAKTFILVCLVVWVSIVMVKAERAQDPQYEHNPLLYDVRVNAHVIPIYAVDEKGNPVFDLKEEDIELYIDEKPFKDFQFLSYQVEEKAVRTGSTGDNKGEEAKKEALTGIAKVGEKERKKGDALKNKSPERVTFIIMDGVSNSKIGIRNAKKLAQGLINAGGPRDWFVLFQVSPIIGFQYLLGPERDKARLLKVIENIYKDPDWVVLVTPKGTGAPLKAISDLERANDMFAYRRQVQRFSSNFKEFKYALKTIRLPKNVYLLSGGFQGIAGDFADFGVNYFANLNIKSLKVYFDEMKQVAAEINKGGSLLYLVNPVPETLKIKKAIDNMKQISNANFISGRHVEDLLVALKNNTAAYYELAFPLSPEWGEHFKIKVKCRRKEVTLNTLMYGEKATPYADMGKAQRELFALNVVTGGSWCRMVGTVKPTVYQELAETSRNNTIIKKVSISIPKRLMGKKIDVFVLNVDPETFKADINMSQRTAGEKEEVEVEVRQGKHQFIVIVEPGNTDCVFSRVS